MSPWRIPGEYRSTVLLTVIVLACLLSLASGQEANWLSRGVQHGVAIAATPFWTALKAVSRTSGYMGGLVFNHTAAFREADRLRGEVARLTAESASIEEMNAENQRLRRMLGYERKETRLSMLPTLIKAREIGWAKATLIVDQGSMRGVRPGMCAMTPDGIAGVVAKVEPWQSFIYTLNHAECRIGAMIRKNRAFGIVRGSGSTLNHICRMEYISQDDDVTTGDLVVSGGSSLFPAGYPIGSVMAPPLGVGTLLKTAQLKPAVDLNRLDEVFIILKTYLEPDEYVGSDPGQEIAPAVPEAPANPSGKAPKLVPEQQLTLQDRFAP